MSHYVPVWFTRQLSGDEVREARQNGIEPIVHPLISIEFEPAGDIIRQTESFPQPDALLFTSRNAVDAFLASRVMRPGWLDKNPIFAVGARTASRLNEAGFDAEFPEQQQDGKAAAELIDEKIKAGSVVWHFCARNKRPEAGDVLREKGHQYFSITSYTTHQLKKAGMPQEPFSAVAFYSPSAVGTFASQKTSLPEGTLIVSSGKTTADALNEAGIKDVAIADHPSTQAILALIRSHFPDSDHG